MVILLKSINKLFIKVCKILKILVNLLIERLKSFYIFYTNFIYENYVF